MFTRPADLPEAALAGALRDRWRFTPVSLEYQAVGFGSHHWLATDAGGERMFATVDDLTAKLRTAQDTTDAAFGRLAGAFATALSLRAEAGLGFVIAPVPASDGRVLARLSGRCQSSSVKYSPSMKVEVTRKSDVPYACTCTLSPLLGRFLIHDLDRLLLATRVGGAALSAGHGFPGRRHALDVRRHSLACTCRAWAQK